MSTLPRSVYVCAALLLFVSPGFGKADDLDSAERSAEALKINTGAAKSYTFEVSGDPPYEPEFRDESLLRWSNPGAGEIYGSVFVWTHQGRPEVVASLYQWYSPYTHGAHEFHSLATTSISGVRDGTPVWKSNQPGVQFRRVPDQHAMDTVRAIRLRRMREIARRFAVKKTDREGVAQEMRLLPQPIYRYPADSSHALDGALFVFVDGTDPEVILLVEARKTGNKWEWEYALTRMNSVQFVARYRDREVWRVELLPWSRVASHLEPYTSFGNIKRPAAIE